MRFEYLQVYFATEGYAAFDGNSHCDGDVSLVKLLNKLGHDRWEYCQHVYEPLNDGWKNNYHLLKREAK